MKPKILLVKHFDHVILGVLFLLLLFAVYQTFLKGDPTIEELKNAIQRADRTVQGGMKDPKAPPHPPPQYLKQLEQRFDRPPVVSPYLNPFVHAKPRIHQPLYLKVGQVVERVLPGVELQPTTLEQLVELAVVEVDYSFDENETTLSIEGVKAGGGEFTIVDSRLQTHVWPLFIREPARLDPPNPLAEVAFSPMPPFEAKEGEEARSRVARVLIVARPNNPRTFNEGVGMTSHIRIERKQADASDLRYEVLTPPETYLEPSTTAEEIDRILEEFRIPGKVQAAVNPSPESSQGPVGGQKLPSQEWEIPVGAREPVIRQLNVRTQTADQGKPRPGSFVFLDATVDPGESYVYRLTSLYWAEDEDPLFCKRPFVSRPVTVPALVTFHVAGGSNVVITRPNPRGTGKLSERFSLDLGMTIRGRSQISYKEYIDNRPIVRREWVDFATNNVLVDTRSTLPVVTYQDVRFDVRTNKFIYRARESKDPMLLYLSGQGALHSKSKDDRKKAAPKTQTGTDIRKSAEKGPVGKKAPVGKGIRVAPPQEPRRFLPKMRNK